MCCYGNISNIAYIFQNEDEPDEDSEHEEAPAAKKKKVC